MKFELPHVWYLGYFTVHLMLVSDRAPGKNKFYRLNFQTIFNYVLTKLDRKKKVNKNLYE